MRSALSLLILLAVFTFGCAQVPLDISRFEPVIDQPSLKIATIKNEPFVIYEDPDYRIAAGLYEYNQVFALSLEIANNTGDDLLPADYSVSLVDGRDLKPIKIFTRQDLMAAKAKLSGTGSSGALQDQLIQATIDTIMNTTNSPTKQKLIGIIEKGIDEYFAFRTIYAGDKRSGAICFLPDFKLEYPVTLTVKVKGKPIAFRFNPPKK